MNTKILPGAESTMKNETTHEAQPQAGSTPTVASFSFLFAFTLGPSAAPNLTIFGIFDSDVAVVGLRVVVVEVELVDVEVVVVSSSVNVGDFS